MADPVDANAQVSPGLIKALLGHFRARGQAMADMTPVDQAKALGLGALTYGPMALGSRMGALQLSRPGPLSANVSPRQLPAEYLAAQRGVQDDLPGAYNMSVNKYTWRRQDPAAANDQRLRVIQGDRSGE